MEVHLRANRNPRNTLPRYTGLARVSAQGIRKDTAARACGKAKAGRLTRLWRWLHDKICSTWGAPTFPTASSNTFSLPLYQQKGDHLSIRYTGASYTDGKPPPSSLDHLSCSLRPGATTPYQRRGLFFSPTVFSETIAPNSRCRYYLRRRQRRIAQLPLKASVGKRRGRGLLFTVWRIERSDFLNSFQYSRIRAESQRFSH